MIQTENCKVCSYSQLLGILENNMERFKMDLCKYNVPDANTHST